ncbi:MAG: SBBP repeat-containing protein [Ferruginibacter sp.]
MKTLQLTLVGLFSIVLVNAQAPVFQWAKGMAGTNTSEGKSITVDVAGNVLTTGVIRDGTVDFDPGPGVYNLTSAGQGDIFISKLDANGNFLWAKRIGNPSTDQGESIATDGAGNVYITGWFSPGGVVNSVPLPVDFDPGPGVFNLSSLTIAIFVLKLDSDGNFVWAKSIMGDNTEYGTSLGIDANGNLFITGAFNGTVDFDPGPGNVSLTQQGGPSQSDIFITKWDLSGNMIWAKQMGGTSAEYPFQMAIDAIGNILLTGYFNGTADFDPGAGTSNLLSAGSTDIFICKLDNNGNFIWVKAMGSSTSEAAYGITTDLFGNVLIAIPLAGVLDVDPGPGSTILTTAGGFDIVFVKLNAAGDFQWARKIGAGGNDEVTALKTDAAGNVYIGGSFSRTVDFDSSPAEVILVAPNAGNIFFSKFDSNGNFVWVARLPGGSGDVFSMCLNASNEIFSTGWYTGTIDFDPGPGVFNLTAGATDIFVNKLSQGGPLPLTLLDFSVEAATRDNVLKWKTAKEINTKEFEIEWSDNGQDFKKIGVQKAAVNSNTESHYTYRHSTQGREDNYYRLKMVDMDGLLTYSKIIRISTMLKSTEVTTFPNPVIDLVKLNIRAMKNESILFHLHSADGKIVASKSFDVIKGSNLFHWNLRAVPAGKYFISSNNDQLKTMSIIKQ